MMEQLIPEDNPQDDMNHHRNIRRLTEQLIEIIDDREFTQDEVRYVIKRFNPRKAPGLDGIAGETLTLVFNCIPKTVTSIYNECLKSGCFPKKLEDSQDNSNHQTWQRRQIRPVQVSPNQFVEYRRQGARKIND
jgi:hypothetical protein